MSKSIKPALTEIEAMYDYVVEQVLRPRFDGFIKSNTARNFQPEPTPPVFLIQQQGRRKTLSWYTPKSWESVTSTAVAAIAGKTHQRPKLAEISLATELLSKDKETILDELLVSSYPHWHFFFRGFYHQQIYTKGMGDNISGMGLYVDNVGGIGWRHLNGRSPRLTKTWEDYQLKNPMAFKLVRDQEVTRKTGSPLKRWSCGCTIIRATAKEINLWCGNCGNPVVYSDHDAFSYHQIHSHTYEDSSGSCSRCGGPATDMIHVTPGLYRKKV